MGLIADLCCRGGFLVVCREVSAGDGEQPGGAWSVRHAQGAAHGGGRHPREKRAAPTPAAAWVTSLQCRAGASLISEVLFFSQKTPAICKGHMPVHRWTAPTLLCARVRGQIYEFSFLMVWCLWLFIPSQSSIFPFTGRAELNHSSLVWGPVE